MSTGVFGTVCDQKWTRKDAEVVCRELGHSTKSMNYHYNNNYRPSYKVEYRITLMFGGTYIWRLLP